MSKNEQWLSLSLSQISSITQRFSSGLSLVRSPEQMCDWTRIRQSCQWLWFLPRPPAHSYNTHDDGEDNFCHTFALVCNRWELLKVLVQQNELSKLQGKGVSHNDLFSTRQGVRQSGCWVNNMHCQTHFTISSIQFWCRQKLFAWEVKTRDTQQTTNAVIGSNKQWVADKQEVRQSGGRVKVL